MRFLMNLIIMIGAVTMSYAQFPGAGNSGPSIVGKISGQVIDSISGEAIEFATVALRRSGTDKDIDGTISGLDGLFEILNHY